MADREETPTEGMERICWMPATNGGPATYFQFGPHDRKGYRGDFLTTRGLGGGELRFDGYRRPQWPSSRA
jgi:branched-chain amino acid transport system substrate-binding protein